MKILVVDDDESILALLDQFLGAICGYEVETSLCGLRALELVMRAREPFDCFLIDIQMPNVDGIELCQKIREIDRYRTTPIVMLTAMTELNYVDRAFGAGADDYVTKPFEFADLKARLEKNQRRPRDEASAQSQPETRVEAVAPAQATPAALFKEAFAIGGIQGVLGNTPFENYIQQMSRIGAHGSSIFAVQMTNAKAAFDRSGPDQFHEIVRLAAKMLSETLDQHGGFTSYRGSGVFLCIQNGKGILSDEQIRNSLNRKLHAQHLNMATRTRFHVGKQYALGWITNPDALAILRGENTDAGRVANTRSPTPAPEDFAGRQDGHLELEAYEWLVVNLLPRNDLMSEHLHTWDDVKAS